MWNLEKWCRLTYLQGRNRDTDGENERVGMGRGEVGMIWKNGIHVYTLLCVKQTVSGDMLYSAGNSAQHSGMTYMDGMGGWEGGLRERRREYT